jgi:intracellular sulfur oxidation DsrE/DsrF family protein
VRLPARLLPAVQALAELPAGALLPSPMPVPLKLPLFGHRVRAGFPSPADDYVEAWLDLNEHLIEHKEATFFVQAAGDSMTGAGIQEGTLLVVDRALDRASYLSALNGADPFDNKIVIALHGAEIPFFAIKNYPKYKALMDRAQSLTVGGIIEFRMCKIAARGHGFEPKDIHGFVNMVPMGDAEIVRLQQEGYAYMR